MNGVRTSFTIHISSKSTPKAASQKVLDELVEHIEMRAVRTREQVNQTKSKREKAELESVAYELENLASTFARVRIEYE